MTLPASCPPVDETTLRELLRDVAKENRLLRLHEGAGVMIVHAGPNAARPFVASVVAIAAARDLQLDLADLVRDDLLRNVDPKAAGTHEVLTSVMREEDGSESFSHRLVKLDTHERVLHSSSGVDPLIPMLMLWLSALIPTWFKTGT